MNTEYHKIETLYERLTEKPFYLKEPLVLKNPTYGLIKNWVWTEKIDGMNIRVIYKPKGIGPREGPEERIVRDEKAGMINFYPEILRYAGKTDNAKLESYKSLSKYLSENLSLEKMRSAFSDSSVVLYGEGYGAGIQKGGLYRPDQAFVLFDVFIMDEKNCLGGWWLNYSAIDDIARSLSIDAVPYIGTWSLESATERVHERFGSRVGSGMAEGLVGKPEETLYDKRGKRIITKIKTKDFSVSKEAWIA